MQIYLADRRAGGAETPANILFSGRMGTISLTERGHATIECVGHLERATRREVPPTNTGNVIEDVFEFGDGSNFRSANDGIHIVMEIENPGLGDAPPQSREIPIDFATAETVGRWLLTLRDIPERGTAA